MCNGQGEVLIMSDDGPVFAGLLCRDHARAHLDTIAETLPVTDVWAVDVLSGEVIAPRPEHADGFAGKLAEIMNRPETDPVFQTVWHEMESRVANAAIAIAGRFN